MRNENGNENVNAQFHLKLNRWSYKLSKKDVFNNLTN